MINTSNSWYVLAIDTYGELRNNQLLLSMVDVGGWRYTMKAKKGDIALAPNILIDMVKFNVDNNNIDLDALNKALRLKNKGNY